jgi:hypothetical protein
MKRAPYDMAPIALTAILATCSILGCRPIDDARKGDVDASVPAVDAGDPLERFCAGGDAGAGCSCFGNTCSRTCAADECQGLAIVCPHGQDCLVDCIGEGACDGLVLECESGDADCALRCAEGACAEARFRCNDNIGTNCCLCEDASSAFSCPRNAGLDSCNPPNPEESRRSPPRWGVHR